MPTQDKPLGPATGCAYGLIAVLAAAVIGLFGAHAIGWILDFTERVMGRLER